MPSDETFETAWKAIDDDDLFKGIIRDWAKSRNERIAAQRHEDRVRGEGITHQFKYGRSMPTTPPRPTHESSEEPAATIPDDSPPPDPPGQEELPPSEPESPPPEPESGEEKKLRAEIPIPDQVREASASDLVSKPPSEKKESPKETVEEAMAREAKSKPPRTNEEEVAAFAGDRQISDEEYDHHSDSYNKRGGDEPEVDEEDERKYPLDRKLKTGRKNKEGSPGGEATTPMTDDARLAFSEHGYDAEIPILDVRGNPFKARKLDDWHIKWDSDKNGIVYFSKSNPKHTYNTSTDDRKTYRKTIDGKPLSPIHASKKTAWFPMPTSQVVELRTGKKVNKAFILKDPFANPFHTPNFLDTSEADPNPRQEYITPIVKSEPPQEKPDLGFDVVEGDDLSLLPASLFAKNAPGGDDMSLLPSGWKSD